MGGSGCYRSEFAAEVVIENSGVPNEDPIEDRYPPRSPPYFRSFNGDNDDSRSNRRYPSKTSGTSEGLEVGRGFLWMLGRLFRYMMFVIGHCLRFGHHSRREILFQAPAPRAGIFLPAIVSDILDAVRTDTSRTVGMRGGPHTHQRHDTFCWQLHDGDGTTASSGRRENRSERLTTSADAWTPQNVIPLWTSGEELRSAPVASQ